MPLESEPRVSLRAALSPAGQLLSARRVFIPNEGKRISNAPEPSQQQESHGSAGWMRPLDVTVVPRKPFESRRRGSEGSYGVAEHGFSHLLRDLLL